MTQTATTKAATNQAATNQTASKSQANRPTRQVDQKTMQAFDQATGYTIVKQVFKKGDSVTYQPIATAATKAQVTKQLKSAKGATHVMAMPSGPVIPASALVDKTYTLKATVANLQVRISKKSNTPWASFGGKRVGKDTLSCIAFGQKVSEIVNVANQAQGQPIKLFGYYKDQTNGDGQQFIVLKAIAPGA